MELLNRQLCLSKEDLLGDHLTCNRTEHETARTGDVHPEALHFIGFTYDRLHIRRDIVHTRPLPYDPDSLCARKHMIHNPRHVLKKIPAVTHFVVIERCRLFTVTVWSAAGDDGAVRSLLHVKIWVVTHKERWADIKIYRLGRKNFVAFAVDRDTESSHRRNLTRPGAGCIDHNIRIDITFIRTDSLNRTGGHFKTRDLGKLFNNDTLTLCSLLMREVSKHRIGVSIALIPVEALYIFDVDTWTKLACVVMCEHPRGNTERILKCDTFFKVLKLRVGIGHKEIPVLVETDIHTQLFLQMLIFINTGLA